MRIFDRGMRLAWLSRNMRIAWQGVRHRPLRSVLSSISLIVGVLAIVAIEAGGLAVRDAILLDSLLRGGRSTTVSVGLDSARSGQPVQTAAYWRELLGGAIVVNAAESSISLGGRPVPELEIFVVTPDLRATRPFILERGEWFGQATSLAPSIVLNRVAFARYGAANAEFTWAAGETIAGRVVGVVNDGNPDATAYVQDDPAAAWRQAVYTSGSVSVWVHRAGVNEAQMRGWVNGIGLRGGRGDEINSVRRTDNPNAELSTVDTTRQIFLGVAALSLLVGSLGLLNLGLSTLRERSDEMSLRRAFGATRRGVLLIMVLESQIVAFIATAVAVGLAAVLLPILLAAWRSGLDAGAVSFPVRAALVGAVASSIAALAGSIAAAVRASRIPISSIMRV